MEQTMQSDPNHAPNKGGYGVIIAILLIVVVSLGALLYLSNTESGGFLKGALVKYDGDQEMIYDDEADQTWIAYPGSPVSITVVTKADCGTACDTSAALGSLRTILTPALAVNTIMADSAEGAALLEKFEVTQVPAYFSDTSVENLAFYETGSQFLIQKDDTYYYENGRFKFPKGTFLVAPTFEDTDTEPGFGSADAPLTVVEFTAYQCGYCKRFLDGAEDVLKEYADAGKIQFVIKDFPIGKPDTHVAANCAGEQDRYMEMHDTLFDNQAAWSRDADGGAAWSRKTAANIGLDMTKFDSCVANGVQLQEILEDQNEGRKYGVTGTPALFFGAEFVPGAIGGDQVRTMIEAQLAAQKLMTAESLDQIVSLCKRRGFAYPGSAIYGGFANSYTYGPYGVELKNNIKNLWWRTFVHAREDMVGIDGDIILHPKTWEASGHTETFNDLMIDNLDSKKRYRADHLIEEQHGVDVEGWTPEQVNEFVEKNGLKCPVSGSKNWTPARRFNLMFQTQMAKTGADSTAYLRPETAQAIFLEYKNVLDTARVKLPFGIGQIGKAFRNEITPGNFIFRRLEFEQMEIEYFCMEKDWETHFDAWWDRMGSWCEMIGLPAEMTHKVEHKEEKLSHYSKKTWDVEFDFPFGQKELYGLAYRTDFDLKQHETHSGKKLRYYDEESKEKVLAHVIEPTFGLDRTVLAVLSSAYTEETLEDGSTRTVLKIVPALAPVKVAILPLMKKDGLPDKAREFQQMLAILGNVEFDVSGAIGKRYRRQDEIGTPVCITIDYDTLEDDTVTVRDRDTMEQVRVHKNDLLAHILKYNYAPTMAQS